MAYKRTTRFIEEIKPFCQNCKQEGHVSSRCPYSRCYWCREKGHITKNCPDGPARKCNDCYKIAYMRYYKERKYYCNICYSKVIAKQYTRNYQEKEEKEENKNVRKGIKAQEIFNQHHDIIYEIFQTILQEKNRFLKYRLKDCSNFMLVNRNIYNSVYDCWNYKKENIKAYYEKHKENGLPGEDKLAEKLGYIEIRCETCKNFRGSHNWEKKHYYSYAAINYDCPIQCDYDKDTAWFKRYTKQQREKIERKDKQKENERKDLQQRKCLCWRKGTGECPKHNHEIIWNENKCLNCENQNNNNYDKNQEKLKENEKQIIETKDHEEKPILRKEYYWDDEVIENGNANLKWKLLINTNIALNNYYINGILINANQQLNEYNERQSKIIKDLGDTI